jgi:hypothetical protein
VVPGGGLSAEGDRWLASRADFLVPVRALSLVFRGQFRDLLAREGLREAVDPSVWRRDWVVHCQPAGDGRQSLRYLAPYVFRVAIGDHRIVACDSGRVTFTYRKVGSKRRRKMTLEAPEFLRRYWQHVLPSGFPKVRHYGFLSPASGVSLDLVRWLIALWAGMRYLLRSGRDEQPAAPLGEPTCAACGGRLVRLGFVPAALASAFDTSSTDERREPRSEKASRTARWPRRDRGARGSRRWAVRRPIASRSAPMSAGSSTAGGPPSPRPATSRRPIEASVSRRRRWSPGSITLRGGPRWSGRAS